jgi:hypothetical protein
VTRYSMTGAAFGFKLRVGARGGSTGGRGGSGAARGGSAAGSFAGKGIDRNAAAGGRRESLLGFARGVLDAPGLDGGSAATGAGVGGGAVAAGTAGAGGGPGGFVGGDGVEGRGAGTSRLGGEVVVAPVAGPAWVGERSAQTAATPAPTPRTIRMGIHFVPERPRSKLVPGPTSPVQSMTRRISDGVGTAMGGVRGGGVTPSGDGGGAGVAGVSGTPDEIGAMGV